MAGGLNLYEYVGSRPTLFTDPLGLVKWTCEYMFATGTSPLFGGGAGIFAANCTSGCIGGKKLRVTVGSTSVGLTAGNPLPVGISFNGSFEAEDPSKVPQAESLAGFFMIGGVSFQIGPFGGSCAQFILGSAKTDGPVCGGGVGFDAGLDVFIGWTAVTDSKEQTCCGGE